MRVFFRCVAEAVVENGVKGLAQMVPGGAYAYAVAEGAFRKYRERCAAAVQQQELRELAAATLDDARAEVVEIARDVFAAGPAAPTPDEAADLELFVAGIPDAVRKSFKRADDPTGHTVRPGFALNSADQVLALLPARPPRFRPGAALPGKSGWVLERLLGTGGFGEVWYARHPRMTSLSGAVKFCFDQTARDLIHEAELIDRVMHAGRHPNIVPLVDVHLDGDRPWLLFEYVDGGTLTDWIHRLAARPAADRLPPVLAALRQLCAAVAHFHRLPAPVVHRDLKPSNILLAAGTDTLRITDFGIGSITAAELNRLDNSRLTRGPLTYPRGSYTPLYSSPQQRAGADPDPRDDVHALGVIAFQMLTGTLADAPALDMAEDLREAGVGEEMIALVSRCVAHKPERRPANAMELLTHLPTSDAERRHAGEQRQTEVVEQARREDEQRKTDAERLRQEVERKTAADRRAKANEPPTDPKPGTVFTLRIEHPSEALPPDRFTVLKWHNEALPADRFTVLRWQPVASS